MTRPIFAIALVLLAVAYAGAAQACTMLMGSDETLRPVRLHEVPVGTKAAIMDCGEMRFPAQIWTLAIDPDARNIGVRDDKLFDPAHTGPLTELISARVEHHARAWVLERSTTAALSLTGNPVPRAAFRRFVTFCDDRDGTDPLDCSVGAMRIKARVTAKHLDRDGHPDVSLHEISLYDGARRLHVLSFVAPYSPAPGGDIARQIAAINAVSDVLRLRTAELSVHPD